MPDNYLYYGDNLDILRRYIKDESVDLVYLDPPFNSAQDYNVLFKEQDGSRSAAQIKAFEDTWTWDQEASREYQEVVELGGNISRALQGMRMFLGESNMMAYIAMMAARLVELHRILKDTSSLYLHCDSTASHYLKIILDATFSPHNFRNEIIWQRTSSHNDSRKWGTVHDVIFFYSKSDNFKWNPVFTMHDPKYIADFYRYRDERGSYRLDHIIRSASMGPRPNLTYEYKNYIPQWGWRVIREKLEKLDSENRIQWSSKGRPYLKRYLEEQKGTPIKSVITDIQPIGPQAAEKLGYPTQKPLTLLERIIKASSNEGDVILDPFCGCGTSIAAAQKLNRRWIGIDITHLAIGLIKSRLLDMFGTDIAKTYTVLGEPTTLSEAIALADQDKFQFQAWALGLVGARVHDSNRKGADKGIDGRLYFHDGDKTGKTKQVIFSVKGGHTDVKDVRDLRGVIEREGAEIGVLITLQEPTKPMRTEAAGAGFYKSPWSENHPKLQIFTIEELLNGKCVDMPLVTGSNVTFKKAPKAEREQTTTQPAMLGLGLDTPIIDEEDEDEELENDDDE